MAVHKKSATSQHSASPKATPVHGSNFSSRRRRLLTGRCTPVRGLNSFLASCAMSKRQLHLATRSRASPHGDRRSTKRSSKLHSWPLHFLRASHATLGRYFFFLSARMMPLPIRCCTSLCPKTNMLPKSAHQQLFGPSEESTSFGYPSLRRGRCGCLSSGP